MPRGVKPETAVYNEHGQRLCEYRGCNRLHNANGLCITHCQQLRRKKPLSPVPKHEHKECSHDGCIRWVKYRGMCELHLREDYLNDYHREYQKKKRDEVIVLKAENIRMEKHIIELENRINTLEQLIKHWDEVRATEEDN